MSDRLSPISAALDALVEHDGFAPGDWRSVALAFEAELDKRGLCVVAKSALRTEYAWVCAPPRGGLPCMHRYSEETVRSIVASGRGAVYVREVTDWRPEVPDAR